MRALIEIYISKFLVDVKSMTPSLLHLRSDYFRAQSKGRCLGIENSIIYSNLDKRQDLAKKSKVKTAHEESSKSPFSRGHR